MGRAHEYRRRAEQCRKLAAEMLDSDHRRQLIRMAEAWERIAGRREAIAAWDEPAGFGPASEA